MSLEALPSLAIICPCLNEEEIIPDNLKQLLSKIKDLSALEDQTTIFMNFVDLTEEIIEYKTGLQFSKVIYN